MLNKIKFDLPELTQWQLGLFLIALTLVVAWVLKILSLRNPYPTPHRTPYRPVKPVTVVEQPAIADRPLGVTAHEPDRVIPYWENARDLFEFACADVYMAYFHRPGGMSDYYRITMFDIHHARRHGQYDRDSIELTKDVYGSFISAEYKALKRLRRRVWERKRLDAKHDGDWEA